MTRSWHKARETRAHGGKPIRGTKCEPVEGKRRSDKTSSQEPLNDTSEVAVASKQSTIMMVDDEPIILETLQMFLEDAGYDNFITTTEPKRALNMVVLKKPDVVLLDVMMPEVSGLDILGQMRSKEALKHIPPIPRPSSRRSSSARPTFSPSPSIRVSSRCGYVTPWPPRPIRIDCSITTDSPDCPTGDSSPSVSMMPW